MLPHNRSTKQAIGKIAKKFEETGRVTNIERPVHHRFAHSTENIAIVSDSVCRRPECFDSLTFSGIKTVIRHITAYFAFRYTPTSI